MKPETLGPIITSLNGIIYDYGELLLDDKLEIPGGLAEAVVMQYVALIQLRNKLVDAATDPS